jgi:hypothetical protein
LPGPPLRMSLPAPPQMMSLPGPALMIWRRVMAGLPTVQVGVRVVAVAVLSLMVVSLV